MSTLTIEQGVLLWQTPYNASLVADLKARVPSYDRQWDKNRRAWRINPHYADILCQLTEQHLGERLIAPQGQVLSKTETRLYEVRYIGSTKDRGNGETSAFGWVAGNWSIIFPEAVLRAWFDAPKTPDLETTLYQVLAVKSSANPQEIKAAYRRLSKQWHPDVCSEAGASVIFRRINEAYLLLSDEKKRARYDVGLMLTATLGTQKTIDLSFLSYQYRSPLRCGLIMCEGREQLGRFIVQTILAWEDIQDATGRTLSVSWPIGADTFTEVWA